MLKKMEEYVDEELEELKLAWYSLKFITAELFNDALPQAWVIWYLWTFYIIQTFG